MAALVTFDVYQVARCGAGGEKPGPAGAALVGGFQGFPRKSRAQFPVGGGLWGAVWVSFFTSKHLHCSGSVAPAPRRTLGRGFLFRQRPLTYPLIHGVRNPESAPPSHFDRRRSCETAQGFR